MPQSTASLRLKAEALRVLRSHAQHLPLTVRTAGLPSFGADRPVKAKVARPCQHGTCLALRVTGTGLEVLVRDLTGAEGWAPIARILSRDECREWARRGFG